VIIMVVEDNIFLTAYFLLVFFIIFNKLKKIKK